MLEYNEKTALLNSLIIQKIILEKRLIKAHDDLDEVNKKIE